MAGSRSLPSRSTRGKRINSLLEEEDSDDESFWNQDAWQEEAQDDDYESEEEEEDVIDSDFNDSESEEDEAEVVVREERKRKALKPPGSKKPPPPRIAVKRARPEAAGGGGGGGALKKEAVSPRLKEALSPRLRARATGVPAPIPAAPRAVRQSTKDRSAAALRELAAKEKERVAREKRLRRRPKAEERLMTQVEMLEEAAHTEIENVASLQRMIAREEATKAKAMCSKKAYAGPLIKFRSFRDGDQARTTLAFRHMKPPPHMEPQRAPPPPQKPLCVITGRTAKYRDPATGLPYADLDAFKQLRRRFGKQAGAAA